MRFFLLVLNRQLTNMLGGAGGTGEGRGGGGGGRGGGDLCISILIGSSEEKSEKG